jgi:hypothetical protein
MDFMWHTEPNGDLTAVVLDLRLVVHEGDRYSRFLLLGRCHRDSGGQDMLLESGCEEDVQSAKSRAIEKAIRRASH